MELVGFSIVAMSEVGRIYATWRAGEVFRYVPANALGMTLLASRQSLIWFALIVVSRNPHPQYVAAMCGGRWRVRSDADRHSLGLQLALWRA